MSLQLHPSRRQFFAEGEFNETQANLFFRVFRVTPANGVKRHSTHLTGPRTGPSQSFVRRHLTQTRHLDLKGLVGSV